MFQMRSSLFIGLFAALAGIVGCSDGVRTIPVQGIVTFNGEPVERAEICFVREGPTKKGEPAPPAIARTEADGTFTLKTGDRLGAVPGRYRVTVQKSNLEDLNIPNPLPKPYRKNDHVAYMIANNLVVQQLLPSKYSDMGNSPLEVDVSTDASKNHFDLMLEGEPPKSLPVKSANSNR